MYLASLSMGDHISLFPRPSLPDSLLLLSPIFPFNERQKADDRNNLSAGSGVKRLIGCSGLVESERGQEAGAERGPFLLNGRGCRADALAREERREKKCCSLIDGD